MPSQSQPTAIEPDVQSAVDAYTRLRASSSDADPTARRDRNNALIDHFYDAVTSFYEFGWGQSFHFAPRRKGESFEDSLVRHEHFLAEQIGATSGRRVLDVGCGVGGPMREIAHHTGAEIVGLNLSDHQIARGEMHNRRAGLQGQCSFVECDFHEVPLPDASFDAAYTIESTCHSTDKVRVFGEVKRMLRPGAVFAGYEWCMTSHYRADDPEHVQIRDGIAVGNALPEIASFEEVSNALEKVGFVSVRLEDRALTSDPEVPWFTPLTGRDRGLRGFPRRPWGRDVVRVLTAALEAVRIAPAGTSEASALLNRAADALVRGGETGVFTPMLYFESRVP